MDLNFVKYHQVLKEITVQRDLKFDVKTKMKNKNYWTP